MGAGNFPGGFGRGGLDPVPDATRSSAKRPPRARLFDGIAKDYQLDDDGRYIEVHPIDSTVFLILRTVASSISSAPGAGQTVGQLATIDRKKIQAQVTDCVTTALDPLVSRRSIVVKSIVTETPPFGGVNFRVDYVNLETIGQNRQRTFRSDAPVIPDGAFVDDAQVGSPEIVDDLQAGSPDIVS